MDCPLIFGGKRILREPFIVKSPFYDGYTYSVSNASTLDVAAAIGCARRADRLNREDRISRLHHAADIFSYTVQDLEHFVRVSGVPVTQAEALFADIPQWLREVPTILEWRFSSNVAGASAPAERISPFAHRLLTSPPGFCYAVTPGNDPRFSALVAANLAYLGIPFVLRASPKDALAPIVIQSLLAAGFDANFCNLLYIDPSHSQSAQKHSRLVDACSIIWTLGPDFSVDETLRYETSRNRLVLELPAELESPGEQTLREALNAGNYRWEFERRDLFAGKTVLRQSSGNSAAILHGPISSAVGQSLLQAIAFPAGHTATKSVMAVNSPFAVDDLASLIAGLHTGDPLDPRTQVGYTQPATLDKLEKLVQINRVRLMVYGGERLSAYQARPMLLACQEELPGLFGQEIPAYLLAVRECATISEAIETLNHYTTGEPRLAVSLYELPKDQQERALNELRAHTLLVNKPTSQVIPIFHEGIDYPLRLSQNRLIIF